MPPVMIKLLLSVLTVFAAAIGLVTSAKTQNYPWCAQYGGGNMGGAMNCGFVSFEQCLATVRGIGGFCMQNNTYQAPPGPHRLSVQRRLTQHQ